MSLKDLGIPLSSKGDLAAAGLGYAAGFAIDVFLFSGGVAPASTAAVFAVGAVAMKNGVVAAWESWRNHRSESRIPPSVPERSTRDRAEILLRLLRDENKPDHWKGGESRKKTADALNDQLQLYDLGVVKEEQVLEEIERIIETVWNRPSRFAEYEPSLSVRVDH